MSISSDDMPSLYNSITHYADSKDRLVQSVSDCLKILSDDLLSITIIKPVRSEEFYVVTATTVLSEDIETHPYSDGSQTT